MSAFTKRVSGRFLILFAALSIGGTIACSSSRSDSANIPANSNVETSAQSSGSNGGIAKNQEQTAIDAEKEKLRKEREKLENEKQELKDEKSKTERLKEASAPSSEITNTVSTVAPPTNIRDSPNGKILCVVKNQATLVKIYGSTDVSDNNGEWFYTKHCGKMGVIHSSQFVSPG